MVSYSGGISDCVQGFGLAIVQFPQAQAAQMKGQLMTGVGQACGGLKKKQESKSVHEVRALH